MHRAQAYRRTLIRFRDLIRVSVDYVTADGNTVDGTKTFAVAPESIDSMSTLYKGATATGNKAFEVPGATAGQGVLAVRAGMLGDKVFVATK